MLSTGLSGFRTFILGLIHVCHAPLSKVILFGTAGISLLVSLTNQKNRWAMVPLSEIISKHQWWRLFSNVWFLTTPGEMLFGILLIYYFRMFERQMGTPRFAGLVLFSFFSSMLVQLAFMALAPEASRTLPSGPYFYIYACFALYYSLVPATTRFRLFGVTLSDKVFVYLLGVQMALAHWPGGLVSAFAGIASAMLYRSDALPFKRIEFPLWLRSFCATRIEPLLHTSAPRFVSLRRRGPQTVRSTGMALPQAGGVPRAMPEVIPSEENINAIVGMGFSRQQAVQALRMTGDDLNAAVNSLLAATDE